MACYFFTMYTMFDYVNLYNFESVVWSCMWRYGETDLLMLNLWYICSTKAWNVMPSNFCYCIIACPTCFSLWFCVCMSCHIAWGWDNNLATIVVAQPHIYVLKAQLQYCGLVHIYLIWQFNCNSGGNVYYQLVWFWMDEFLITLFAVLRS